MTDDDDGGDVAKTEEGDCELLFSGDLFLESVQESSPALEIGLSARG